MHYLETFPKSGTVEVLDIFFKKLPLLLRLTDFSRTSFCSSVDPNVSQRNSLPFALAEQNKTGSPAEKLAKPGSRRPPGTARRSCGAGAPTARTVPSGAGRARCQELIPNVLLPPWQRPSVPVKEVLHQPYASAEPQEVPIYLSGSQNTSAPLPARPRPRRWSGDARAVAPQQDPGLWQGCSPPQPPPNLELRAV